MRTNTAAATIIWLALFNAAAFAQANVYVITNKSIGSTTWEFTVTQNGKTISTYSHSFLQTALDTIRNHAKGKDCTIQFGKGNAALEGYGEAKIEHYMPKPKLIKVKKDTVIIDKQGKEQLTAKTVSVPDTVKLDSIFWGKVTLTGKIATPGNINNAHKLTVNGANVTSKIDVTELNLKIESGELDIIGGTIKNPKASDKTSSIAVAGGTLNIKGGSISAPQGNTLLINRGTVNITGGTLETENGAAIRVAGTSVGDTAQILNISGGAIKATGENGMAVAIYDGNTNITGGTITAKSSALRTNQSVQNKQKGFVAKVNISGKAQISSTATATKSLEAAISSNGGKIEIAGGTIKNTSTGDAIRVSSDTITISGGTIESPKGYALYPTASGNVAITGKPIIKGKIYDPNEKPPQPLCKIGNNCSYATDKNACTGAGGKVVESCK